MYFYALLLLVAQLQLQNLQKLKNIIWIGKPHEYIMLS